MSGTGRTALGAKAHHRRRSTRRLRRLVLLVLVGLIILAMTEVASAAPPTVPALVGTRAGHHPGFDRIVFDLEP